MGRTQGLSIRHCHMLLRITFFFFGTVHVALGQLSYDRAALRELAQFPQQHRFTDGRLCASLFAQNDRVYTNCTTAATPDGQTGREWCFVADQLRIKNEKNWGYCSPPVDYNFVRAKANEAFLAKINEVTKMVTRLDNERSRLGDILLRYNATCGSRHDAVGIRLGKIESFIDKADRSVVQIMETTKKIGVIQQSISMLTDEINALKAAPPAPENCAAIQGYEDDPFPDGLRAAYYPSPTFKGAPIYRVDEVIDFEWTAKDPLPGIPHQGFSIRWKGYIQAPYTGEYIFTTVADCGVRVFLNEEPVIVDRMPLPSGTPSLAQQEGEVALLPPSEFDGPRKVSSPEIMLTAGEKNALRVEMIHSTHLRWANPDDASIQLLWSSSGIPSQVVPKNVFYQSNVKSPLKISGLNPADFDITLLYDGEFAYKGSTTHFLADVPLLFYGLKTIRASPTPTAEKLTFHINVPATLFIGTPAGSTSPPFSPCEGTLHETSHVISVFEALNRTMRATSATHFTIFEMDIASPGDFGINFMRPGVPFIAFLRPKKEFEGGCGGKAFVVSDPMTSPVYDSCDVSSVSGPEFGCQYGLGHVQVDQPFGTWRSTGGNGVGEFLAVRFKKPVQLTQFRFIPRNDPLTWPAEIMLSFAESILDTAGKTKSFTVSHAGNLDALRYPLDAVVTLYVKAEVSRMYVNGQDTGGSFEFWGTECRNEDSTAQKLETPSGASPTAYVSSSSTNAPEESSLPQLTSVKCTDTLDDVQEAHPLEEGRTIHVACPAECFAKYASPSSSFLVARLDLHQEDPSASSWTVTHPDSSLIEDSPLASNVYGSDVYAPESELCSAAAHAGLCVEQRGTSGGVACTVTVKLVKHAEAFTSELKNGIQSEAHGPAEFGVIFAPLQTNSHPVSEASSALFGISFRAADLGGTLPQGYLLDDGGLFGTKNNAGSHIMYGWEKTASVVQCTGATSTQQNPLNQGGIEFPPDPASSVCDSGITDCAPNEWKIALPASGMYRISVQVGNPCRPQEGIRRYYLQANALPVINGEELPKGRYFWATADIMVSNKTLTLTAACPIEGPQRQAACNTAVTTLMNVKISQLHA